MITIVGLGPGAPDAVPKRALDELAGRSPLFAPEVDAGLIAALGLEAVPISAPDDLPAAATVAASDSEAHRLARRLPGAATVPDRPALRARAIGAEVAALAEVGAHLRVECPWDRVQTPETIVPHTVEEAFEVAEAVAAGDDAALADELGDLLFQSVFLAQLLEEKGEVDLSSVARGQTRKLVRRHPHVYGDASAEGADGVRDLWERTKREERAEQGIFHDLPPGLPALAFATKAQKRAGSVGFEFRDAEEALRKLREEVGELAADPGERELGDVLFAGVAVARALKVDPEIALRAASGRFRRRVDAAAALAASEGRRPDDLDAESWLALYECARRDAE